MSSSGSNSSSSIRHVQAVIVHNCFFSSSIDTWAGVATFSSASAPLERTPEYAYEGKPVFWSPNSIKFKIRFIKFDIRQVEEERTRCNLTKEYHTIHDSFMTFSNGTFSRVACNNRMFEWSATGRIGSTVAYATLASAHLWITAPKRTTSRRMRTNGQVSQRPRSHFRDYEYVDTSWIRVLRGVYSMKCLNET